MILASTAEINESERDAIEKTRCFISNYWPPPGRSHPRPVIAGPRTRALKKDLGQEARSSRINGFGKGFDRKMGGLGSPARLGNLRREAGGSRIDGFGKEFDRKMKGLGGPARVETPGPKARSLVPWTQGPEPWAQGAVILASVAELNESERGTIQKTMCFISNYWPPPGRSHPRPMIEGPRQRAKKHIKSTKSKKTVFFLRFSTVLKRREAVIADFWPPRAILQEA